MNCRTNQRKGRSSYRPSWFVLLALFVVSFSALRVSLGAPVAELAFPLVVLAATIVLDLSPR